MPAAGEDTSESVKLKLAGKKKKGKKSPDGDESEVHSLEKKSVPIEFMA